MEVKEALKWFEWADDVYYCSMPNASPNNEFYKQSKEIKNLLKSMEAENKKLKQENKAYKGMWKELKPTDDYEALILEEKNLLSTMSKLEQKYLNNGENNGTEKY